GLFPARPLAHGRARRGSRVMSSQPARIDRAPFGIMGDGTGVERITLRGADGFEAAIVPYGGTLQALKVPDRTGRSDDVVLGHDNLGDYLSARRYFGATGGRYANRVARA